MIRIGIVGMREIGATIMFWPFLWNVDNAIIQNHLQGKVLVEFLVRENRGQDVLLKSLRNIHVKKMNFFDFCIPKTYDLVVNPFPFQNRVARFFSWFKGKKYASLKNKAFFFEKNDHTLKMHEYYVRFLDVVSEMLGVEGYVKTARPKLQVRKSDTLKKFGLKKNKYVVFGPSTEEISCAWSEEVFQHMYELSQSRDKLLVVLVGQNKFYEYPGTNVMDLTKKTSLGEWLQIIYNAKKVYTTETGTLHVAAHMGKEVVATVSAITPWFVPDDMPNVTTMINEEICPYFRCHMKFPFSQCPFEKRFCLTNAVAKLPEAEEIRLRLLEK